MGVDGRYLHICCVGVFHDSGKYSMILFNTFCFITANLISSQTQRNSNARRRSQIFCTRELWAQTPPCCRESVRRIGVSVKFRTSLPSIVTANGNEKRRWHYAQSRPDETDIGRIAAHIRHWLSCCRLILALVRFFFAATNV